MSPAVPGLGSSRRTQWLRHPLFIGAVAMLLVNDHVLKARFPGWWTGKLSDAAGIVVVGVLAAVVLGAPRGLAVTGVAFTALKSVPGVAELLRPLLGGGRFASVVIVPAADAIFAVAAIAAGLSPRLVPPPPRASPLFPPAPPPPPMHS